MPKDNKAMADAIVVSMGGGKKDPDYVDRGDDDSEEMSELQVAAQEILDAVSESDADALSDALKSFIKLCKYESEEGE